MFRFLLILLVCLASLPQFVPAAPPALAQSHQLGSLPRGTPESQGISSAAIASFVEAASKNVHDIHSFMVVRHGKVVAEGWWSPYAADRPHMLFSLSKSFTSTAVGLAAGEGRFTLDDPVISFFPEEAPANPSENLKKMRVRDLLAMASGHATDTVTPMRNDPDGNWVRAFLGLPVEFAPGTHFMYNSGATYMLSAIVQKRTGLTVLEYLKPRLFTPLGITGMTWETCPRGINCGGWGLKLRTGEIARFGQLYLQKGVWQGRRLLPEGWVEQATTAHSDNSTRKDPDWNKGYCYQFWRCQHGAYRGDGAFGQFCVVMPEQDAVVVMTAGAGNLQGELSLVWDYLLPAMKSAPLPADPAAEARLKKIVAGLALAPVEGQTTSPLADQVSGKTYRFDADGKISYIFMARDQKISRVKVAFGADASTLTLVDERGAHTIVCGWNRWIKGTIANLTDRGDPIQPVAASAAWTAPDTWTARLCLYETPFCLTLRCRFDAGRLRVSYQREASAKPTEFVSTGVESH